ALAALRARSVGLNQRYGLGAYAPGATGAAAAGVGVPLKLAPSTPPGYNPGGPPQYPSQGQGMTLEQLAAKMAQDAMSPQFTELQGEQAARQAQLKAQTDAITGFNKAAAAALAA